MDERKCDSNGCSCGEVIDNDIVEIRCVVEMTREVRPGSSQAVVGQETGNNSSRSSGPAFQKQSYSTVMKIERRMVGKNSEVSIANRGETETPSMSRVTDVRLELGIWEAVTRY